LSHPVYDCHNGLFIVSVYRLSPLSNVYVARSFAQVIQLLTSHQLRADLERAFVIGGESVYQVCNKLRSHSPGVSSTQHCV